MQSQKIMNIVTGAANTAYQKSITAKLYFCILRVILITPAYDTAATKIIIQPSK